MKAVTNLAPDVLLSKEYKKKADYQNVFDDSPLAMFITDSSTSQIVEINKAAVDKYGYSREEFLCLTIDSLNTDKVCRHNKVRSFTIHQTKGGESLYVEIKKSSLIYNTVSYGIMIINDVTANVLAAENEKKSKQRLKALFRDTHNAVLLASDMGKYIRANNRACSMLGYTEDELLTLSVSDVVVSIKDDNKENLWDQFLETGNQSGVTELKKKDGQIIICRYNASTNVLPGLHLSIVTDITQQENERIKKEQQLKYVDRIIQSITDCFFIVDNNWIIQYWNKAAEQLLKKSAAEVIGRDLWEVYHDAVGSRFYQQYFEAMYSKKPVHFEEYYSALDLWLDISAYPASDGLTVYFRDITNRKKQALDTLQARNNQSALINSTGDLIWSFDKDLKLVSFNKAFEKRIEHVTGKKAFVGLQLPAKFPEADKCEHWKSLYARALQGEIFNVDETIKDLVTGQTTYIDVSFHPMYAVNSDKVVGVACYSHDVTLRIKDQLLIKEQNEQLKLNKENLQRLTKKLEKVMNSSLDVICVINTEGRFVQVSEASNQVLGYSPEELTGKFVLDFIDPQYLEVTLDAGLSLAAGNDLPGFQNIYLHKSGRKVPLNWSARFDEDEKLVYAVARDNSSQQEAERLKAVAEQRFTALVQKGADMVGIIDAQANYKYASPNIESVLGYRPEAMSNKSALQLVHPEDMHIVYAELENVAKGGEPKLAAFRLKNARGEWRWLETIATNQLNNPAIEGIVLNSRDITNRKVIEAERELMIKELLKSNADLKQFSFITSHNFRAPLSNITGILNIIDYNGLDDYNKQMIEMLDVSAKQLQQTIDDLSKILVIKNNINIEVSTIDLEESIREVKNTFINTLNDVCVDIHCNFKQKNIHFNKTYFESILVNLVSNAIKYRSRKRNLLINVTCEESVDGNSIFTFSDNGSGIDLSIHKSKVFGLYQRFHNNTEGHGLGLFIIKSQIVALGGKIEVESEPEQGTTFTITFKKQFSEAV